MGKNGKEWGNALPQFINFVLVKASEPRYGTTDQPFKTNTNCTNQTNHHEAPNIRKIRKIRGIGTEALSSVSATNEGTWMSATAILSFLKEKVGISLLKPTNAATFGRRLSNMSGLKKRETRSNTEYLLKRKKA